MLHWQKERRERRVVDRIELSSGGKREQLEGACEDGDERGACARLPALCARELPAIRAYSMSKQWYGSAGPYVRLFELTLLY